MKRLLTLIKILFIGSVWSGIYIGILVPLAKRFFFVDLLNPHDYMRFFRAFLENRWQIDSFGDLILLILLLGFVPFWFIGWIVCYKKRPSLKLFRRTKKAKMLPDGSLKGLPQKKAFVPEKMRTQAAGLLNMSLEEAQNQVRQNAAATSTTNSQEQDETTARRDADIADISALAKQYEVEVFTNLLFAGEHIPIAISTDEKAILVWLINHPDEQWSVDLSEGTDHGNWFGSTQQIPSPVGTLKKVCSALRESEPDSEVIPLIVLTSGQILNESDILPAYRNDGINVAVFKNAKTNAIPSLSDVLNVFFGTGGSNAADNNRQDSVDEHIFSPSSKEDQNQTESSSDNTPTPIIPPAPLPPVLPGNHS